MKTWEGEWREFNGHTYPGGSSQCRSEIGRRSGSGSQIVAMMQAAEPRHGYNSGACIVALLGLTTSRRSLRQRQMRSVVMVIADVIIHEPFQVAFIEDDHMIKQVPTTIADPSFGNAVLPRALETGSLWLNAEALYCADDFFVEVRAAIEDQILRCRVVGKGLAQLLYNPGARWVPGQVEMKKTPPVVGNDEEAIQHTESERWYSEEIHRGDSLTMVAQKGRPLLRRLRIPRSLPHPAQYRSLRNVEAKHVEFTMNARRTPMSGSQPPCER
jgi:hypothetical protein